MQQLPSCGIFETLRTAVNQSFDEMPNPIGNGNDFFEQIPNEKSTTSTLKTPDTTPADRRTARQATSYPPRLWRRKREKH